MSQIAEKWDKIISKIHLILDRNTALEKEVSKLQSFIERLESDKKQLQKEKEALNNQINVLKLAKGVGLSDRERMEVKKQIKHYISEIDECLAKMNE